MIVNSRGRALCICNKCGHKWFPRRQKGGTKIREPWKCPNLDCQSCAWNIPQTMDDISRDRDLVVNIGDVGDDMVNPELLAEIDKTNKEIRELENKQRLKEKQEKENMAAGDDYVKKSDIQHKELTECLNCIKEDNKTVKEKIISLENQLSSLREIKDDIKNLKDSGAAPCPKCGKYGIPELASFCPYCGATGFTWIDENDNDK